MAQVEGNLRRQIEDTMPAGAPGFYFIDIQPGQVASFETTVRGIDGVGKVRRVPMLRGRITAVNGIQAAASQVRPDVAWVLRNDRGLTWSAAARRSYTLLIASGSVSSGTTTVAIGYPRISCSASYAEAVSGWAKASVHTTPPRSSGSVASSWALRLGGATTPVQPERHRIGAARGTPGRRPKAYASWVSWWCTSRSRATSGPPGRAHCSR